MCGGLTLAHSSFHRCDRSLGAFGPERGQILLLAGNRLPDIHEHGKANMGDQEGLGRKASVTGWSCNRLTQAMTLHVTCLTN